MLTIAEKGEKGAIFGHFRIRCGMLKNVRFHVTAGHFAESLIFAPMKVLLKRQGSNPHGITQNPSEWL